MPSRNASSLLPVLLLGVAGVFLLNQHRPTTEHEEAAAPTNQSVFTPKVSGASTEGERALRSFKIPSGFEVSLFAAEPSVINPVTLDVDGRGRVLVVEAYRRAHGGSVDNRHHAYWIDDDLLSETIEDRRALLLKHHPEYPKQWEGISDRVRHLIDDDVDGRADRSLVFADGFDDLLAGTAAGVLRVGDDVFFACIPEIWRLTDSDHDGIAETREAVYTGFGVRIAYRGHDMHGLIQGPDGRIYWSIGDRGYNVLDRDGKRHKMPNGGAVFRMEPDGSEFEVFANGLRNPQELAFDDFGNLITGDNNSDGGDLARIVHVVRGGDSGWRMNYQYISNRGPWVTEEWYKPAFPHQAAFLVPPIANLGNGPSGFAHDPGVGLPTEWAGRFFLCDFKGSKNRSGIRSFHLAPKGATFSLHDANWFMQHVLTTDVAFGPAGGIYLTDWVEGWVGPGKGRIYRIALKNQPRSGDLHFDTPTLLAKSFTEQQDEALLRLLEHTDRRVRQKAHLELARRGEASLAPLAKLALESAHKLARLHAMWAASIIIRRNGLSAVAFRPLLWVKDNEVRAQATTMMGDSENSEAYSRIIELTRDANSSVAYAAAMALGDYGKKEAIAPLIALLSRNNSTDRVLMHGAIYALSRIDSADAMVAAALNKSSAVRTGAVVVLRRKEDARVAIFLDDKDPHVVAEAARAIYDTPIDAALPRLADCLNNGGKDADVVVRRALAAWCLLGGEQAAKQIANFAGNDRASGSMRREALSHLSSWVTPPLRDPILNMPRLTPERHLPHLQSATRAILQEILESKTTSLQVSAANVAGASALPSLAPVLMTLIERSDRSPKVQVAALNALTSIGVPGRTATARAALQSKNGGVRAAALNLIVSLGGSDAAELVAAALERGSQQEQQLALTALGQMNTQKTDALLAQHMRTAIRGEYPSDCLLELLEATRRRAAASMSNGLQRLLDDYHESADADAPLFRFAAALAGGDTRKGRKLFVESTKAQCNRCHNLTEKKTELPGPDLTDVGRRLKPQEILESIARPNERIADGFENVLIETRNGRSYAGRLLAETESTLKIELLDSGTPEVKQLHVRDIVTRIRTASSMPGDLIDQLTIRELRDLVSFLSQLKKK